MSFEHLKIGEESADVLRRRLTETFFSIHRRIDFIPGRLNIRPTNFRMLKEASINRSNRSEAFGSGASAYGNSESAVASEDNSGTAAAAPLAQQSSRIQHENHATFRIDGGAAEAGTIQRLKRPQRLMTIPDDRAIHHHQADHPSGRSDDDNRLPRFHRHTAFD